MVQRWSGLNANPALLGCLDTADNDTRAGPWPGLANRQTKNRWGNIFADECAVMVANELRQREAFSSYVVRPREDGSGTESLTGVGGSEHKKVDVIVSNLASGLQVAISLKAENFASNEGSYGKNLLNRLYELSDETRSIHLYQPRAVVVGVFFLPLHASMDRPNRSGLHRAVEAIRSRTGRNPAIGSEYYKLDLGYVGLYAPTDIYADNGKLIAMRGALRFVDVRKPVPRAGRPMVGESLELDEIGDRIVDYYLEGVEERIADSEPEPD